MPPLRAEAFSLLGKAPPSLQTTESAKFKMKYASQRILSQPRLVYTRRLLFTDPPFPNAKKLSLIARAFSIIKLSRNSSFDDLVVPVLFPLSFIVIAASLKFICSSCVLFFKITCIFNRTDHIEYGVIAIIIR